MKTFIAASVSSLRRLYVAGHVLPAARALLARPLTRYDPAIPIVAQAPAEGF
jgi:hypothetical protein